MKRCIGNMKVIMTAIARLTQCTLVLVLLLATTQRSLSQQKLNLDFEKLSVEGLTRPWGWTINAYAQGVEVGCDSTVSSSGSHSLKIGNYEALVSSRFEYSFFVEPSQIINSTLTIEAYAKSRDFTGNAGVELVSIGEVGGEYGSLDENRVNVKNSEEWEFYSTEITLNGKPHSVLISLYFEGTGTIWFDDLRLKINGKRVREVPVAEAFSPEQQESIAKNTVVFKTVEPISSSHLSSASFKDLDYLKEIIGDAKIVGLGESTHGTSEFFKVKHRILQYAISQLSVRLFILEDNQLLVERVNDYVLYGRGDPDKVIKGLFKVWNTEEMLQLIKWVRSYNVANPDDMVEFAGVDIQNPQLALEAIDDFLKKEDTVLYMLSSKLLESLRTDWRESYFQADTTLLKWDRDAQTNLEMISSNKSKWLAQSKNRTDSIKVEWAEQNARAIKQFVEGILGGNHKGRDKAMADNVTWILNHRRPDTRAILWAHDSHISRGDSKASDNNYFFGESMGSYLSKQYKSDYCAIGLFTYHGTCLGTISYQDFTQVEFEIYTSPIGSLDEALHQISRDTNSNFLIANLKSYKRNDESLDWITMKRPVRYVGYVAEDYGFGGRYSIPYQFDGIVYIDFSTAAQEISNN